MTTDGDRALRQLLDPATPASRAARARLAQAAAGNRVPPAPATRGRATTITHTIRGGEALWNIAQRYGVTVEGLASANRIALSSVLQPGQQLIVPVSRVRRAAAEPARPGRPQAAPVQHIVRSGDTLWDIARRYNRRVEDIVTLNDLGHSEWIRPGQRVLISSDALPRYRRSPPGAGSRPGSQPMLAQATVPGPTAGFAWPARGTLTSRFGWRWRRHHNGIDLAGPQGTPIYSAGAGVVEFAGWHAGYGRMVHVDHGNGVVTLYGHASRLLVSVGQRVTKGQLIARVGCTGWCTGSHLHFEVRVNGGAVDPLRYLR